MATLTLQCRTERTDEQGYAPVRLRVSQRGTRRYVQLEITVLASKWNEGRGRVTPSHPNAAEVNGRLSATESEAQAALSEAPPSSSAGEIAAAIRQRLHGPTSSEGFLAFADEHVAGYKQRGQVGTHRQYKSTIDDFRSFLSETGRISGSADSLPFSRMTARLLRQYRNWCYEQGNATNTVGKKLTYIKVIWNRAQAEGETDSDIFAGITVDSEPTQKEKLTFEEIQSLETLSLEEESKCWHALNYFLFALYTGGMRWSDVALLRWEHVSNGRVHWRMKKTKEGAGVPLTPKATAILEAYQEREKARVFPILDGYDLSTETKRESAIGSQNTRVNERLKTIQERAGLSTHLTFHLSRHSAAWVLYRELEDIYKVKEILGHSSVKVTEKYLEGFPQDFDDDFRDIDAFQ